MIISKIFYCFFFFNDTATTEIYTLSLHDALPIAGPGLDWNGQPCAQGPIRPFVGAVRFANSRGDRKSTRLNSSHVSISYAVFCLKKKISYFLPFFCFKKKIKYNLD